MRGLTRVFGRVSPRMASDGLIRAYRTIDYLALYADTVSVAITLLQKGSAMLRIFLVTFSPNALSDALLHLKVEAPSFAPVDVWATANTPKGYTLFGIEAVYHDSAHEMYGDTDVVLDDAGSRVHTDTAAYAQVITNACDEWRVWGDERKRLALTLATDMQRQTNMIGGRPSDSARSAVYALRRANSVEAYIAEVDEAGSALRKMGY